MWPYQIESSSSRPRTSECVAAAGSAVETATNKLSDYRHTSVCLSCSEADRRCNKPTLNIYAQSNFKYSVFIRCTKDLWRFLILGFNWGYGWSLICEVCPPAPFTFCEIRAGSHHIRFHSGNLTSSFLQFIVRPKHWIDFVCFSLIKMSPCKLDKH